MKDVGHASALVVAADGSSSIYISWWPTANALKSEEGASHTYDQDIEAEKCEPDIVFNVSGLNEAKAIQFWQDLLSSDAETYDIYKQNCSWAVVSALKAAGSDEYFPWHQKLESKNLFKPRNQGGFLTVIARYVTHSLRLLILKAGAFFSFLRPLVDIGDRYAATWSPEDLEDYCRILVVNIKRTREGERLWWPNIETDM